MKTLKEADSKLDFEMFQDSKGTIWYRLLSDVQYISHRFNKTKTLPKGYVSDGATGAEDIVSKSWFVHDKLCEDMKWDDGSYCSPLQSSYVLHDILMKENRWVRAKVWFLFTFVFQSIKHCGRR
jgi:hypothetical protein